MIFQVQPAVEQLTALARLYPHSPFCTPEYATARARLGERSVLMGRMQGGSLQWGSVGFISRTGWFRTLDVPSFHSIDDGKGWVELLRRARGQIIGRASLNTYASRAGVIPPLPWATDRRRRVEHVLDLRQPIRLSPQHSRAVKKAVTAGASLVRLRTADAAVAHQRLVNASLSRRLQRGEAVEFVQADEARMLLAVGAGEVVQAIVAGEAVSSVLLLYSATSAYYHSAGTSPAGMDIGASPFLISRCARLVMEDGRSSFNIGDATEDNPGLLRFKRGFGGDEVLLEAATIGLLPFTGLGRADKSRRDKGAN